MNSSSDYEKVALGEDAPSIAGSLGYYHPQRKANIRGVVLAGLAATLTFIVGLGVGTSTGSPFTSSSGPSNGGGPAVQGPFVESSQCGNTTAEARALGCSYDLLSATWWPAECQDQTTSKEFEEWLKSPKRVRPWPFFYDEEGTRHIESIEELAELAGKDIWTTQEFHAGHCILWWKRLHKSMEGRINTNIWAGEYHHTAHCTGVLLETDWSSVGEVYARVPSGGGFGWCRKPLSEVEGDLKA